MDEKTRVLAALAGERVDRAPVTGIITSVTQAMMQAFDAPWPDGHRDADLMARLGAAGHAMYGLETVKVPFDVVVEAEALGGEVNFGGPAVYPQLIAPVFEHPRQFAVPGDFTRRGRVPVVLEAIRLLRDRFGDRVAVVSSTMGPLSVCGIIFGLETFLVWMLTEPDKYHQAMAVGTEMAALSAQAQLEAGADVIQFGEAAASGNMISPRHYTENVAPYHRRLISAIMAPTVFHVCGDITGHLEAIVSTGVSAISFDERVDMSVARRVLKGRVAMVGNVPVERLARGTPEENRALCHKALVDGVDLLNAGCSLPTDTPGINLEAMVEQGRLGVG